jgi:hypothetical protein
VKVILEILLKGRIKYFKRRSLRNRLNSGIWYTQENVLASNTKDGNLIVTFSCTEQNRVSQFIRILKHGYGLDIYKVLTTLLPDEKGELAS